jgi:carbon starvation protein
LVWVTLVPMAWLVSITTTASYQKIFDANPRIGFLAQARVLATPIASGAVPAGKTADTQRLIFNNRLDAVVTAILLVLVLVLVVEAIGEWIALARGRAPAALHESPYVATQWAEGD